MRISDWSSDVCSSDLHGSDNDVRFDKRVFRIALVARSSNMFGVSAGDIGAEGTSCVAVCFLDDRKICFFDELIEGLLGAYGYSQRNDLDGEDIPPGGGDLVEESNRRGFERLPQLFVLTFAGPRQEATGGA